MKINQDEEPREGGGQVGHGCGAESVNTEDRIGTKTHFKEGEARTLELSITEGHLTGVRSQL